jgi:alkanesulfonate monooxygenase SsuD/methylene tetrahydromethanopterin reductase-like flavin-dependent oxidoreductase (luciferase family)
MQSAPRLPPVYVALAVEWPETCLVRDAHRDRVRAECERIGRSFEEIEVTALDPEDLRSEEIRGYRWTPRWETERIRQWRERGVDHVIVNIDPGPANLRRFGEEVIAAVA